MKRKWEEPRILIEEFTPNEYISACYDTTNGKLEVWCELPSQGTYWETIFAPHRKRDCGTLTEISYTNQTGRENRHNAVITNLNIDDPDGGVLENKTYDATWISTYLGITYHHVGKARVTNVTVNGNHS